MQANAIAAIPNRSLVVHLHGSPIPIVEVFRKIAVGLGMKCKAETIELYDNTDCWSESTANPKTQGSARAVTYREDRTVTYEVYAAVSPDDVASKSLDQMSAVLRGRLASDVLYFEDCRSGNCSVAKDQTATVVQRARAGDASRENLLGDWLCNGALGFKANSREAADWYRKASDQGNQDAQTSLGRLYELGIGVQEDHDRAVALIRRGTLGKGNATRPPFDHSQAGVAFAIAREYLDGAQNDRHPMIDSCAVPVPKNVQRSMQWLHLSFEARAQAHQTHGNFIDAARELGKLSESEPSVRDLAEAAHWYGVAASYGDGAAMSALGRMYAAGDGIPQSYATAASWYRRAIAHGIWTCNYELAQLYEKGLGVAQDSGAALELYYQVLNMTPGGYKDSQQRLLEILSTRLGFSISDGNVERLRQGAASGDAWARIALGIKYELGMAVPKRKYTALALYKVAVAAEQASDANHVPNLVPWFGDSRIQWREEQDGDALRFAVEMALPGKFLDALDDSVAKPPFEMTDNYVD